MNVQDSLPLLARPFSLLPEHVNEETLPIFDASVKEVREAPIEGYWVVRLADVLSAPALVIAFGLPNVSVYLPPAQPKANGAVSLDRVSVKSLRRGPTRYLPNQTMIQSGLWLVVHDVPSDTIENLRRRARELDSQEARFPTCVNGSCQLLHSAGFRLGEGTEVPLENRKFPMRTFLSMVYDGLFLGEREMKVSVIRTAPSGTEWILKSAVMAEFATPWRHGRRLLPRSINKWIDKQQLRLERRAVRKPMAPPLEDMEYRGNLTLKISRPSRLARYLRVLWGSHSVFTVEYPDNIRIHDYFNEDLVPFGNSSKNLLTRLKRNILFSPTMIRLYRSILVDSYAEFRNVSESWIYKMLLADDVCNYVITDEGINVARVKIRLGFVDWFLSKHLLISGWERRDNSTERIPHYGGGEIVKMVSTKGTVQSGTILINPNSGTLCPEERHFKKTEALFRALFPSLPFEFDNSFFQDKN